MKSLILLIILVAAALVAFAYSGMYSVAVGTGHNAVTRWYLTTLRERSIEARAEDLVVPADLGSDKRIHEGAGHYGEMCAGCHGHPGKEPTDHFDPAPPALFRHAAEPDEAFWIIKNGIKMTAMPQHRDHSDEDIWNIVAFLQRLPQLSVDEYEAMTADAKHHDEKEGHDQSAGTQELPADPVAAVDAFSRALQAGDGKGALALLHDKATVLEEGQIETKQEYAGHHLGADMEFMSHVQAEQVSRESKVDGQLATVTTRSHMSGHYDGSAVEEMWDESVSLFHTEHGWIITHIQWSPAGSDAGETAVPSDATKDATS